MLLARVIKRVLGAGDDVPPPVKEMLTRQASAPVEPGEPVMAAEPMLTRAPQAPTPRQSQEPTTPMLVRTPGHVDAFTPQTAVPAESGHETGQLLTRGPLPVSIPAPEVPQQLLTRTPSLDMGLADSPTAPYVPPAEAGTAPLMRDPKGRTITKPAMHDTGDRLEDLGDYRRQLEDDRDPKDRDGRFMSSLKMAGRGFSSGGLVGALTGGVYGAASPNINERLDRDRELARTQGQENRELLTRKTLSGLADDEVERVYKGEQARDLLTRGPRDAEKEEAQRIVDIYNHLDEFDSASTDPEIQQLVTRARGLSRPLALPKKTAKDRFTLGMAQDGTAIRLNTRTGDTLDVGRHAKPPAFKLDRLRDILGVPDEKRLTDEALASVMPNRDKRLTPQGQQMLEARRAYQRQNNEPDDDATVIQTLLEDGTPMNAIWEGAENNEEFSRRLAAARNAGRAKYGDREKLAARLETALGNYRPPDKADVTIQLDALLQDYKGLLEMPTKTKEQRSKRSELIEDFFRSLNRADIR